VAAILVIFVRSNLPNFVQFTKQRQHRQHKATPKTCPSTAKPTQS